MRTCLPGPQFRTHPRGRRERVTIYSAIPSSRVALGVTARSEIGANVDRVDDVCQESPLAERSEENMHPVVRHHVLKVLLHRLGIALRYALHTRPPDAHATTNQSRRLRWYLRISLSLCRAVRRGNTA